MTQLICRNSATGHHAKT